MQRHNQLCGHVVLKHAHAARVCSIEILYTATEYLREHYYACHAKRSCLRLVNFRGTSFNFTNTKSKYWSTSSKADQFEDAFLKQIDEISSDHNLDLRLVCECFQGHITHLVHDLINRVLVSPVSLEVFLCHRILFLGQKSWQGRDGHVEADVGIAIKVFHQLSAKKSA